MKKAIFTKSLIVVCGAICTVLSAGKVEIVSATYGAGDSRVDVKKKIIDTSVIEDIIAIDVSNKLVLKDPAHGKVKTLIVKYMDNGKEKTAEFKEGSSALIAPGVKPQKEFSVHKAFYGAKNKWLDVSKQIKEAIKDKKSIEVSNSTFKKDPIRGIGKYLVVIYSENNKLYLKKVPEHEKFTGNSM